jgi:4-hydroxybenzoate polyprenyltransferase
MLATGSWSTWSRISRRSSTSEALGAPGLGRRLAGLVRLIHPFPSLLDAVVAAGAAFVAGGTSLTAVRLGLAMLAMQASIGALNDLVDAPRDAGLKPSKPIPAGLVDRRAAWVVAAGGALVCLALSVPSGPATVALAAAILAVGYAYDLRFKGTAWSWLPFAVAIPLFPTFGWVGAAGDLAPFFVVLLPTAVLAGAALAIANARADIERDVAAGVESVATRLGMARSWAVHAGLLAAVCGLAVGSLVGRAGSESIALTAAAAAVVVLGAVWGRGGDPVRRERAWEIEAVGVGLLAAAWLVGVTVAAG